LNASSVRSSGQGPTHLEPREPAIFTHIALTSHPPGQGCVCIYRGFLRIASSGLKGLHQAPSSAIAISAPAAARAYARIVSAEASGETGQ
jgi:hypothetical protein